MGITAIRPDVAEQLLQRDRGLSLDEGVDGALQPRRLSTRPSTSEDGLDGDGAEQQGSRDEMHYGLYQRSCVVDRQGRHVLVENLHGDLYAAPVRTPGWRLGYARVEFPMGPLRPNDERADSQGLALKRREAGGVQGG